jgi:hypothetical protein
VISRGEDPYQEAQVRTWWKIEAVGRRGDGGVCSTRGIVRIAVALGGFKRSTFAREIFRNKTIPANELLRNTCTRLILGQISIQQKRHYIISNDKIEIHGRVGGGGM